MNIHKIPSWPNEVLVEVGDTKYKMYDCFILANGSVMVVEQ